MELKKVKQKLGLIALFCFAAGFLLPLYAQSGLVWEDNFDGNSLDLSKWNIVDAEDWGGAPGCWYAPKNIEVSNGTIKLHSYEETYLAPNGYTYGWTGCKVESTYHPQYKYLEARLRHTQANTYIWATWWTVGWANGAFVWPPEMDICEYAHQWGDWTPSQSSWWWGAGGVPVYDTRLTNMDESQWHTYGAYWTAEDSVMFYVDGIVSNCPVTPVEQDAMAMLMMLSSSPNRDDHPNGCPLASMEVDYVRVYNNPPAQPAPPQHLAAGKPATASSYINSAETPKKAFDGYITSRWESVWSDPQWIQVDLEAICSVNQIRLYWQYAAGRDYQVYISDYPWGPWTQCTAVNGNAATDTWLTYNFGAQTGRFVRLNCTARTTEWGYSLFEMQVYGSVINANPPAIPTRPNLALNRAATASSVQVDYNGENFSPSKAVDGNTSSRWASEWSDPQWLMVDMGSTQTIDTAVIFWEGAAAYAYTVEISSNSNGPWTVCKSMTNGGGGWYTLEFPRQTGRYVRIYGTIRASEYGYSIFELELYGPVSTAPTPAPTMTPTPPPAVNNLALNKTAVSSSNENTDLSAAMAIDGNAGTRWASAFSDPQWIYVDLGASSSISRVILNWETAYGSDYQIQVSDNASSWSTIYTVSGGDGGVDDLIVSGSGRYVRMYGTARGTGWGYSLWEFEIYGNGPAPTATRTPAPTSTPTHTTAIATSTPTHTTASNTATSTPTRTPAPTNSPTPPVSNTNLALNKTASSSSNEGDGMTAGYAVDGNTGTRWSSAFSDPQWISVDLGAVYTVSRVVLNWETAYGSAYQIQVSNDNANWTSIYSATAGTGGVETLTVTGGGRYVRMYGTARGTGYGYSLWEFEVYGGGSVSTATPTQASANTPTPIPTPTPGSGTGNVTLLHAYACDVDSFPFGGSTANRNSMVEATSAQYTAISANNSSEWATVDPGRSDEIFLWIEMNAGRTGSSISSLTFTFNGNTDGSSAAEHRIYVKRSSDSWESSSAWVQIGSMSIQPDVDTNFTVTITSGIADYVDGSGNITWGVYETLSSEDMRINYINLAVN
ncbi:MAG: discoidin domain-containing protein [Spirochaetales bacterium]|nr:discoidin domain-containing protein [Spirochaetales bacterium]